MGEATTDPVRLPPAPRIPKLTQGIGFVASRDKAVAAVARRHGPEFVLNLPIFGPSVVISDPGLVKELFTMNTDLIARAGTLGEVLGPATYAAGEPAHSRGIAAAPGRGGRAVFYRRMARVPSHAFEAVAQVSA